jgi:tetratricopeptide (TPR) repeat protein
MTLTNLALMNQSEGKLEDAEKMLEEVLALRKKNKTSASDLSETLNNLAVIEISQNKLAEAEDHLNEALELLPSAAESGYIDKMPVLNNQCKLQLKKGKLELARQACIKSSQLLDRYIEDVLAGTSFAEKRQFLQSRLPAQISLLISTNTRDEEAQETYSFLAKWKGILIESMRQESRIMRLSTDTKYTADIARLLALRARFTELLHLSSKLNLNDWKQSSDEILQEKENIERKLLGVRNREQDTLSELSIPRLSSMLREDEMLVDFYSYLAEDKNAEASYAVFFLSAGKVSGIKKLGAALAINHDIDVWRKKVIARIDASAELESIRNRISPLLQA